ncbi:hypothetical protein PANT_19c00052 [Moesziomyces antarcticus T-34]|uniref:Uncharacterized protein n=1 Tax=Pseudozyma antarctica (strain T-34) TaxID=1151754 RepID=M9MF89_PSEA3|nr:hypothetical protein PANT_19c00052 [Moesziomyces antarcticus T-34]
MKFSPAAIFGLAMVVSHAVLGAPIPSPKPIEDILPYQFPDAANGQIIASGDSASAIPALLAAGFNPNDNSRLHGN